MLVGARHHEAVEAASREFGTQRCEAFGRRRRRLEPVVGLGEFCPPGSQCLGQFGIGLGGDQFDPFRAGQSFGGSGHAAHQGVQGGWIRVSAAPAQQLEDVVGG